MVGGRDPVAPRPVSVADDLAVGDVIELEVGQVAHGGHCVARVDGRVVFVRYGLPGERARVRITEVRAGSFCRGDVVEVLTRGERPGRRAVRALPPGRLRRLRLPARLR